MKRRKVIKHMENNGWWLHRHGAEHYIYTNGEEKIAIPRHPDINEETAKDIMRKTGRKQ